jgi:pyruvate dehydrogenase (quinone)
MIGAKATYSAVMNCDLFPTPTSLGIVGSIRAALQMLLERVAARADNRFFEEVNDARRKWDMMLDAQADLARSEDRIHPQSVARISDLAKRDAVFVFDTGLNTLWSAIWTRQSGSHRIIGSFNNGAVGTALGRANGIQALGRSRQVIALCGDGGVNMLMGEFMTAVHHGRVSHDAARFRRPVREQDLGISVDGQAIHRSTTLNHRSEEQTCR